MNNAWFTPSSPAAAPARAGWLEGSFTASQAAHKNIVPVTQGERLDHMHRLAPIGDSQAEKIFNALVSLKVTTSQIAMHLSKLERERLFDEIGGMLNTDCWDAEDILPERTSFLNFLRWSIFAHRKNWDSLGFSDEGYTLAAWVLEDSRLTASFYPSDKVFWSWTRHLENGNEVASGVTVLRNFAALTDFYLGKENP